MAEKAKKKLGQSADVRPAKKRSVYENLGPDKGAATRFTSENQPSNELKKKGHAKRRLLKDLLEMAFTGPKGGKLKKAAATYLGIPEEELTVEDMMHFRQIERAIGKQNTFAYMAVMDRAFGKPKGQGDEDTPLHIKVTVNSGANAHTKH